ncbi:MAG: GGDEF domain-containing protein [Trueperaceae bacterium]|nr:GGDEF domain-containing protein [Trueperaceae bacterium]
MSDPGDRRDDAADAVDVVTWRARFEREREAREEAERLLRDVSRARLEAQREAERQRALLDTMLDNADAYFYVKDEAGRFEYVNAKGARLFGLPRDAIVGRHQSEILPPEMSEEFARSDREVFETRRSVVLRERGVDEHGEPVTFWTTKAPFTGPDGSCRLVGFSTDVTELDDLRAELERLATLDPLTGLPNARSFDASAEAALARAERAGEPLSVLLMDLDHFKTVNDRFGHAAGDAVLAHVAGLLRAGARTGDVPARLGGEEFVVLLPDIDPAGARRVAERLLATLREARVEVEGSEVAVTASVGVAAWRPGEANLSPALRRADRAMYRAKDAGRDGVAGGEDGAS